MTHNGIQRVEVMLNGEVSIGTKTAGNEDKKREEWGVESGKWEEEWYSREEDAFFPSRGLI